LILVASALAGCNDAVLVEVQSDRPVPQAIDNICLGVADASPAGGHFGHAYRLEGALASLPQSLRVEPGGATSAFAWVRGDRGGVPAVRAAAATDFGRDVTLALPKCVVGPAAPPAVYGDPVGPANARLAASAGEGGTLVVAVGGGATAIVDARGGNLVANAAPGSPAGNVVAIVAADLDGDCDDDLVIATDGAPPTVWLRELDGFVVGGTIGTGVVDAIATADVDRDGDIDVVTGAGGTLALWRNDGGATFTRDPAALAGGGHVNAISALALGDVDGDGNPDLIVGQHNAPLAAWLGEPGGTGSFLFSTGAVPPVALDVESLAFADADGDFDPDLAVAVRDAPMRLYIDRDGLLEDQSFIRLPQPAPIAHAVALGGWDDGCEPDAVIAADAGADTLRGQPGGTYATDAAAPPATAVIMADIDDDGDLDALLATAQGVTWLAR
jgi:hypothetical protein